MKLFDELKERGLIDNVTDQNLSDVLENEKVSFYLGTDPTGDSLHIGHLAIYLLSKRLQNKGHNPILLIGGATGFIGDPKPGSEREFLSKEKLDYNAKCLTKQVRNLMPGCKVVNNYDWIKNISLIDYLRDYGKLFNVNYMINKDTVKSRLDTGISYTEFSYQILQGLDFHHLYKNDDCKLQIGGQDQWGNITGGLELIRKMEGHESKAYGLTMPLITKSDGTKFGKSESGAIWLDSEKTSPYEFYQFLLNTNDSDVVSRLKQFTFLSLEEINKIENEFNEKPHERLAQKTLGRELTTLLHGEDSYNEAVKITEVLFKGNIKDLTAKQIEQGLNGVPTLELSEEKGLLDALKELGLSKSNREARDFIKGNAIALNGEKISDEKFIITKEIAIEEKFIVIKRGKKQYGLVKF